MRVLVEKERVWKFDGVDKKILALLSMNCRIPNSEIARYVGRSREDVAYRIGRLEKNRVIVGYLTGINLRKLGFFTSHVFLKMRAFSKEKEKKTIEYLRDLPFVNAIIVYFGGWDLEVSVVAKDIFEAYEYINTIVDRLGAIDHEILVRIKSVRFGALPEDFLKVKVPTLNRRIIDKEIELTDEDYKILSAISENARAPITLISKEVGLPTETVRYRLNRMWRHNVITDFRPVINYAAMGFTVSALLVRLKDHSKKSIGILHRAMADRHVLWGAEGLGKWDSILYIIADRKEQLHEVVGRIRDKMGETLLEYSSMVAVKEPKYTYFTPNIIPK